MPVKSNKNKNKNKNKSLKSSSTIINLSIITKLYYKLYNKYIKYSPEEIQKLKDKINDKSDGMNIYTTQEFITQSIENSKKFKDEILKKKIKNIVEYIPSNSSKKDSCFKQYKKDKELGTGMYGTSYLASNGQHKYAIKIQSINPEINLDAEVNISKKMGELGIGPKIYDSYYCNYNGDNKVFIVQEYINGGTLKSWLNDGNKLTPQLIKNIHEKINKMHTNGYYHGDIHSENILLKLNKSNKKEPEIFIIDFGLSKDNQFINSQYKEIDFNQINMLIHGTMGLDEEVIKDLVIKDIIVNRIKFKY